MGTFCSSIGCAVISTSSAFMLCIQQHLIDIYVIDDIHYTRYYVDGHCTGLRRDCCHPPDWSHEGLAAAAWPPASSVCTGVVLPWRMWGCRVRVTVILALGGTFRRFWDTEAAHYIYSVDRNKIISVSIVRCYPRPLSMYATQLGMGQSSDDVDTPRHEQICWVAIGQKWLLLSRVLACGRAVTLT